MVVSNFISSFQKEARCSRELLGEAGGPFVSAVVVAVCKEVVVLQVDVLKFVVRFCGGVEAGLISETQPGIFCQGLGYLEAEQDLCLGTVVGFVAVLEVCSECDAVVRVEKNRLSWREKSWSTYREASMFQYLRKLRL